MKKHEKIAFMLVVELTLKGERHPFKKLCSIYDVIIPRNRLIYYVNKWTDKGFWEFGGSVESGWLLEYTKMPKRYQKLYMISYVNFIEER